MNEYHNVDYYEHIKKTGLIPDLEKLPELSQCTDKFINALMSNCQKLIATNKYLIEENKKLDQETNYLADKIHGIEKNIFSSDNKVRTVKEIRKEAKLFVKTNKCKK